MLPSRALWCTLRGMRKRLLCSALYGHAPGEDDGYGYIRCLLCGTWIL
jgi:hypothetical protein